MKAEMFNLLPYVRSFEQIFLFSGNAQSRSTRLLPYEAAL
jgi:hypothetical protein